MKSELKRIQDTEAFKKSALHGDNQAYMDRNNKLISSVIPSQTQLLGDFSVTRQVYDTHQYFRNMKGKQNIEK